MEFQLSLERVIHDITKADLSDQIVTPLTIQEKRLKWIKRFGYLIEKAEEIGISFEVCINGSFVANNEEPNDIGNAFFFDPDTANSLSDYKKNFG
ncbi:MAG: hypothetical protein EOM06_05965 [Sphingobacteriia bacterium]|nr:hypothetical protein [Sphingobacteriia bacterium]